jgi:periplasmic protein CpxP/Spy
MKRLIIMTGLIFITAVPVLAQSTTFDSNLFAQAYKGYTFAFGPSQANVTVFGPNSRGIGALETGLSGMWWRDPEWVKNLGLTTDQQKKMDDAWQQYRLKLIDLNASLEKEELLLEPLIESVRPEDQPKIMGQIDRIADARAELEKANARMLLGMRQVLTQEQWSKLPSSKAGKLLKLYNLKKN